MVNTSLTLTTLTALLFLERMAPPPGPVAQARGNLSNSRGSRIMPRHAYKRWDGAKRSTEDWDNLDKVSHFPSSSSLKKTRRRMNHEQVWICSHVTPR